MHVINTAREFRGNAVPRRARRRRRQAGSIGAVALALAAAALLTLPGAASAKTVGEWNQEDVNAAITNGVDYLTSVQNGDGSFGGSVPVAETALAITSYGVQDGGHYGNLPANEQAALQNAVNWLLTQQNPDGDFGHDGGGFYETYDTGLALLALSFSGDVPTSPAGGVAPAIAKGREFLIEKQETTGGTGPGGACQSTGANNSGFGGQRWCGGWNYEELAKFVEPRSDESNTGFAITGLAATGGVPASVAALNEGWQRNVQEFSGNTYGSPTLRNDGGASYEPETDFGDFSSNANDSGTNLFSYGFDKVSEADPAVQASMAFDKEVLASYELEKAKLLTEGGTNPLDGMHMIYHSGATLETACTLEEAGCEWHSGGGEGGFHYSMFSLTKGLSQYTSASLGEPSNYYAQVVDLLLSQQRPQGQEEAGSWPADLRDDASVIGSTAFSILALGRVGAPAEISGTVYNDANNNGTLDAGDSGLAGWTVYVEVNGKEDPTGQPQAVTAADGTYSIQNIPEGSFPVRVVGQSGYTCTQPSSGCAYSEQFASDVKLTGLNFGQFKPAPTTTTTTATATPAAKKPAAAVLASGNAHIVSDTTGKCLAHSGYVAIVRGNSISSATFVIDGHKLITLHKPNSHGVFSIHINVNSGHQHHLTVNLVFTPSSHTNPKTLHQTLARCAVRKKVQPRFTG